MGQGCSTSFGCSVVDAASRSDKTAESPDPVMKEIMKASLSSIESLRAKAHLERFGTEQKKPMYVSPQEQQQQQQRPESSSSSKRNHRTKVTGQDHLLFQNLEKFGSLECASSGGGSSQQLSLKPRGRGNHRRIAESFEAGRNGETNTTAETNPSGKSGSGTNPSKATAAAGDADREDFDVALSKTIGVECPTRLWIRRRPFSKLKRKNRRQQQQQGSDDDLGVVMLERGGFYQPDAEYFGKSDSDSCKGNDEPDETGEYTNHNASIPNPYRSTHIYAIRCSDQDENNDQRGDDDSVSGCGPETPRDNGSSSSLNGGTPRTESPPLPATDLPEVTKVAGPSAVTTKNALDELFLKDPEASGASIFEPSRMAMKPKRDVLSWTPVSQEHSIYVVDLGLTKEECDSLVTTTEQACQGRYAAYTYAKQTLGCREYPLLARAAFGPVHSMVGAILEKFGGKGPAKANANAKPASAAANENSSGGGDAPTKPPLRYVKRVNLQLDDREPHIVKYDVTKKERQKLDMHTDKSEWTFLIALSNGCGFDYEGGGTYFESLDATVHIQKGHALVFPGALRHRGQAIHHGLRFLLVGFLIDKGGGFMVSRAPQQPHRQARSALTNDSAQGAPEATTDDATNSGPVKPPPPATTTTASATTAATLSDDAGLTEDGPPLAPTVAAA